MGHKNQDVLVDNNTNDISSLPPIGVDLPRNEGTNQDALAYNNTNDSDVCRTDIGNHNMLIYNDKRDDLLSAIPLDIKSKNVNMNQQILTDNKTNDDMSHILDCESDISKNNHSNQDVISVNYTEIYNTSENMAKLTSPKENNSSPAIPLPANEQEVSENDYLNKSNDCKNTTY